MLFQHAMHDCRIMVVWEAVVSQSRMRADDKQHNPKDAWRIQTQRHRRDVRILG